MERSTYVFVVIPAAAPVNGCLKICAELSWHLDFKKII